jgi:hypothetical protein
MNTETNDLERLEPGVALHHYGDEAIAFYLSAALEVEIAVFEKMLKERDLVSIDMCMWVATSLRDGTVFEHDAVAERVRARVRELTGWKGVQQQKGNKP